MDIVSGLCPEPRRSAPLGAERRGALGLAPSLPRNALQSAAMLSAELFRCPGCHAPLRAGGRQLSCESCGRSWSERGGYFDLIDTSAGEPTASSAEQRLMESELVARLYERLWRPTFVRLLAGGGTDAFTGGFGGEFFIHKNALSIGERTGPWLDLSCGPGTFTRAMASAAPGDWVVGLDISRPMLDAAA